MKRYFLLIEGALCGKYINKEDAVKDYEKAKKDFPYYDELIELAEVIETTANEETKEVGKTTTYGKFKSLVNVFFHDEKSGISLSRKKREE